jgi:hypothetical protein
MEFVDLQRKRGRIDSERHSLTRRLQHHIFIVANFQRWLKSR